MKILEVTTEHTVPFKVLIEVLKEMLQETNIEFRYDGKVEPEPKISKEHDDVEEELETDDVDNEQNNEENEDENEEENEEDDSSKNKSGMRIMAIDTSQTVLINLKLDAKNFFTFKCTKKRILAGVNLSCLYKLIKSMDKRDILSLYIEHDDKSNLGILIKNADAKKETKYNLKLLDLDDVKIAIPDVIFDAVVTMKSSEFHKICREMSQIAEYVELQCLADKFIFKCKGEYASRETTYKNSEDESDDSSVNIKHASSTNKTCPEIVQGVFELKNLVMFSKCASLCTDIEIYLKNDYPLVIKYTVATLGRILLCLSPTKSDNTKNANFSDEDEYYSDE